MVFSINKTAREWKQQLTPEQYRVCREKGTEPPFSGIYASCKDAGVYHCVCCNHPLFRSTAKYDSGTGWPSFWEPISPDSVIFEKDYHLFMKRIEVLCPQCGAHLGHVFDDGPEPSNQRYCMNSVALKLLEAKD
ncbi:peptide-methionine (R)-S-oxide reductase MsrB [Deltaproteobacteria bacterium TL4]